MSEWGFIPQLPGTRERRSVVEWFEVIWSIDWEQVASSLDAGKAVGIILLLSPVATSGAVFGLLGDRLVKVWGSYGPLSAGLEVDSSGVLPVVLSPLSEGGPAGYHCSVLYETSLRGWDG